MNTLYHYCNTAAFVEIIKSRSLRLSSLALSNDTMEGRIVHHVVMALAREDGLSGYQLQRLEESVGFMEKLFDGLGFCLSEDGDLLSQWRGYADNASGLSIGFSKAYIEKLAEVLEKKNVSTFTLQKVEYDIDVHRKHVAPTYKELRKLIGAGAFKTSALSILLNARSEEEITAERQRVEKARMKLFINLLKLFPKLFLLKTYGFREEREWRLVSTVFRKDKDICDYRAAASGRVVPYMMFDLADLNMQVVEEVILGPRHPTPEDIVVAMLKRYGFEGVRVRRSDATYR